MSEEINADIKDIKAAIKARGWGWEKCPSFTASDLFCHVVRTVDDDFHSATYGPRNKRESLLISYFLADQSERARVKPAGDEWADLSTDELLAICHERGWEMTMIRESDVWRVRRACCDGQFLDVNLPDAIRRCMYESARWEAAR